MTATKDGITSNTVNVNACDFISVYIDIFDVGLVARNYLPIHNKWSVLL